MGKANFTEDFERDAVVQITQRGYPVAEAAARLGISKYSLYEWRKRYGKPAAVARDDDQAAEVRRLKDPLSKRAQEDQRQTELIRAAWSESGKVYSYRKLHDDLAEPVREPGRELLPQPGCAADAACRHPGADRLQAAPRPIWRQAIPGGRQHARSPV